MTSLGLSDGSDYTLDAGLFNVPWAWLDDESVIEEAWRLAAACGGRFSADPDGMFRYENAAHWLTSPHDTSQETLDKGDFNKLGRRGSQSRELYKAVTVGGGRPASILAEDVIWQSDEVVQVPANSTKSITARLRQPAYSVRSIDYTATDGGTDDLDSNVSIAATYYAQRVDMDITNSHASKAAFLVNLSMTGNTVHGGPSVEETCESSDNYWDDREGRTRQVRGNVYVQTRSQAARCQVFCATFMTRTECSSGIAAYQGSLAAGWVIG